MNFFLIKGKFCNRLNLLIIKILRFILDLKNRKKIREILESTEKRDFLYLKDSTFSYYFVIEI